MKIYKQEKNNFMFISGIILGWLNLGEGVIGALLCVYLMIKRFLGDCHMTEETLEETETSCSGSPTGNQKFSCVHFDN